MSPVQVQVIAYTPTAFYHCQHCELTFREAGFGAGLQREQARESLPEDLRWEFERVSGWIHSLAERYGSRIRLRLIDAASIEGFWTSLRSGARRYPAIVVEGTVHGWDDLDAAEGHIRRAAATAGTPTAREGGGAAG